MILFFTYIFLVQICIACALSNPLVRKTVCGGFKDELSYWYEVQNCFKLLTVICALYVGSAVGQVAMMLALILALSLLTLVHRPYTDDKNTWMELKLHAVEVSSCPFLLSCILNNYKSLESKSASYRGVVVACCS